MKINSKQQSNFFVHETAEVSPLAKIGDNTKVWNLAQIRENSNIGENCIISKNTYIDFDVIIGNNVKIQNNCSIYHGATIEDGVFIGPHVCITNDKVPRAINKDGSIKSAKDWKVGKTLIKKGASLGAGTIVLPDVTIGEFALIGSGSVVTKNIPDNALAFGNPAQIKGYVCYCGEKLDDKYSCKTCKITIEINE